MAKLKVDFSGTDREIKSGGRAAHVPEGDYLLRIKKHELRKNKNDNGRHLSWQFQIASGKYKGKTLYMVTALKPDALWNLRNLIHAATGKNVAGKVVDFEPTNLYEKIIAATTEDDEWEGKIKSAIVDVRPKEEIGDDDDDEDDDDDDAEDDEDEEVEEDEEEEEKPKAKAKKKKKKPKDDEDEELEEIDVEDI